MAVALETPKAFCLGDFNNHAEPEWVLAKVVGSFPGFTQVVLEFIYEIDFSYDFVLERVDSV